MSLITSLAALFGCGKQKDKITEFHEKTDSPTLKDCDQAFRAWLKSPHRSHTEQQTIEILGSYLGQCCVQDLPMEWVKVTDQYGEDYAVRHVKSEAMGFPFSSVMKRIEDKQHDFMHGVFHTIKNTIEGRDLMGRESGANQ